MEGPQRSTLPSAERVQRGCVEKRSAIKAHCKEDELSVMSFNPLGLWLDPLKKREDVYLKF